VKFTALLTHGTKSVLFPTECLHSTILSLYVVFYKAHAEI